MDRWNRATISLISLLVLVAAIITVLAATEAIDSDFLPGEEEEAWFYAELKGVADFTGGDQAVTIVVAIVVAVVMLGLFLLEVRQLRRCEVRLPVSATPEGFLTIEASSVRLLAERTGIVNRNVSSLRCRLGVRRRPPTGDAASIIIECYPRLLLGTDVQEVRDDLQTRIKNTVQRLTGLIVLQVNIVQVRYDKDSETRLIGS